MIDVLNRDIAGREIVSIARHVWPADCWRMVTEDGYEWDMTLRLTGDLVVELQLLGWMEMRKDD